MNSKQKTLEHNTCTYNISTVKPTVIWIYIKISRIYFLSPEISIPLFSPKTVPYSYLPKEYSKEKDFSPEKDVFYNILTCYIIVCGMVRRWAECAMISTCCLQLPTPTPFPPLSFSNIFSESVFLYELWM